MTFVENFLKKRDNEVKLEGDKNAHLLKLSLIEGNVSLDICRGCTITYAKKLITECERKDYEKLGL